jgi:putative MATE family efflux protein
MQERKELNGVLNTDKIGRLMVKLSLPVFMGIFVQTLYNIINTIFVGQYTGSLGIAGLSIVFPIQMFGVGLGTLAGIGGMSLISRLLGGQDKERAEKVLGNGISLSVILGAVVVIGILPFTEFWLKLIGASEAVMPYARDYLSIITVGMVFQIVGMSLLNYARAEGNARVGMVAMIMGAVLSIILSAIFIIWLDMGVKGAALATVIAQIVSMAYIFSYYLSGSSYLTLHTKNYIPDLKIIKSMFSIGAGAFMQLFAGSLSSMVLISMVVSYGGDYALSAFGIVQRVFMFANMPAMVISQGSQPILGFNYGAKRFGHALKTMNMALIASIILSTIGFLVVYFIPGPIIRIFSDDPELVSVGAYAAKRIFLALPLVGPMMVGTMVFQAIGKPVQAFIAAAARPVAFLIPAALILGHFFNLDGVWLSYPTADLLTFLLVLVIILPVLNTFRKATAAAKEDKTDHVSQGPLLKPAENPIID